MKCVDCGNRCLNRCSGCGRPYCANCRDSSGFKACLTFCRAKQAIKKQQAVAAQQKSRQVQAPAYTPPPALARYASALPGIQGATPPTQNLPSTSKRAPRTMLFLMDEQEFKAWRERTGDALEDAKARGEVYLSRRRQSGKRTSTDIGMERDQVLFEDLLEALDEIETLYAWANVEQKLQSGAQHSGQTGFMIMYDDQGKVKP